MRVCVLMPFLDVYKGGNHLPLFRALPDVQFTVLTGSVHPKDVVLPANVRAVKLDGRLGSYYYGFADRRFAREVLRAYPAGHPFWKDFDVLHLNQTLHPSLLKLQESGVPLLYAVHHPVTVDLGAALGECSPVEGLLWRARYYSLVVWQRRICREAPYIMTVSQTVAERLQDDYACDPAKISIVPNGVDGERFTVVDRKPEFDVIAVGSFLHPRKGFRYLFETYRALARDGVRIADVGKRSPTQRGQLQKLTGVTSFGTVPDDKIIELIQRSSILVSTSLYEGFGLSLIEALACGRPAFAFDAGAVAEVLVPIDPSLVVPIRDSAALVRRVHAFLNLSSSERLLRGSRYREEVLKRYSLAASAQALWNVYRSLAGNHLSP
ncbi:MAG: glycosyltransferase family 4 protein [Candidatus Peribacteraceae bacterium]|nr:glycosyltransferase family 4 protein [Candidatus Peribacteraceae bacterium]MDD5740106.1 glycosyltransferase family 4 protein [Candidatus Peribacteraceae bacterium]